MIAMNSRRWTLVVVLALINLPVALAAAAAISFYSHYANNGTIVSSGDDREYLIHVPERYDARRPTPLVISMHGGAVWPALQKDISGWNALADEHGFIVVYPSGTGRRLRAWSVGPGPGLDKNVRFIADLIDTHSATHHVDPARIYADGMSNGAAMAFMLSCRMPDRIAAVGLVAAAFLVPFESCGEASPMPMIAFHGTADPVTPYDGGRTWVAPVVFPSVPAFTADWSRRNGCAPGSVESTVTNSVSRRAHTNCSAGADVVLYTITGGGHTWPGGGQLPEWFVGPTSHSVSATSEMWAFFRDHPLR